MPADAAAPCPPIDREVRPPSIDDTATYNPPPPQHRATRDLRWKIERTGTGEAAKCTAQPIEACATRATNPCKPPVESHLCPYESQAPSDPKRVYPMEVTQRHCDDFCVVAGTDERTYCADEWTPPK